MKTLLSDPYALFMGHLAIEKLLKAIVVKATQEHAPFTHSLTLLANKLNMEIPEETLKKLAKSMEFHFEARYPQSRSNFTRKEYFLCLYPRFSAKIFGSVVSLNY